MNLFPGKRLKDKTDHDLKDFNIFLCRLFPLSLLSHVQTYVSVLGSSLKSAGHNRHKQRVNNGVLAFFKRSQLHFLWSSLDLRVSKPEAVFPRCFTTHVLAATSSFFTQILHAVGTDFSHVEANFVAVNLKTINARATV